jgi:hypothetical protein
VGRKNLQADTVDVDRSTAAALAFATTATSGDPFSAAATWCFATQTGALDDFTGEAPAAGGRSTEFEIDRDMLAGVEDRAPVRSADQNYYEFRAYNYLLIHAHKTPVTWLTEKARHDLTFAHLFEEPEKYRGQVVHVEGTIRRLRRFDPSRRAVKEGVPNLYEGWIFGDVYSGNPFCVIASELGPPLEIGERLDRRVSFDGYFFKRYRYKGGDTWRDAPLLIGRVIQPQELREALADAPSSFSRLALPGFLALLIATAGLCIALTWWFRRGDRQVRRRIEGARGAAFIAPAAPPAPPEPE